MTIDQLIKSAEKLGGYSRQSANLYEEKIPLMTARINDMMLKRGDITELIGPNNLEMMKDNHQNHAHFIASMLLKFDPNILVHTILWVFRAYRSRKFHTTYWAAQLNTWRRVIREELPENNASEILALYNWMQAHIPMFEQLSSRQIDEYISSHPEKHD